MILFLFGQWGAGKSYVAQNIESITHLPHLDADTFFPQDLVDAVKTLSLHPDDMAAYYDEVVTEMARFRQRHSHFLVTQGVYTDAYRRQIYRAFLPDIHFVLVKTSDPVVQRARIARRAYETGNPVSVKAYEHMAQFWEPISIPHSVVYNDEFLEEAVHHLLASCHLLPQAQVLRSH